MEAFPNLAVAIGILVSVINPCFIDVHYLSRCFGLQSHLKLLAFEWIALLIAVSLFFSTDSQLLQRITDVLLCHTFSPQGCHLPLSLTAMLLDKLLEPSPVRDFMSTPLLIVPHRSTLPGLGFSFEPLV